MNDLQYYTKEINDCRETQCQSDLLNGKIKITDVPFAFRGHDEYTAAHKYARGLVDEKERYYLYWKIAECMESDMSSGSLTSISLSRKYGDSDVIFLTFGNAL